MQAFRGSERRQMKPFVMDELTESLERMAKEREKTILHEGNEGEETVTGPAVHEHSDTWGFAWMPVIENFVEQATPEREAGNDSVTLDDDDTNDPGDESASPKKQKQQQQRRHREEEGGIEGGGATASGRCGRNRRRPRPPSYNETLLADKTFHNPHASETMADAYGILRPASFVLDVRADDRTWGVTASGTGAKDKDESNDRSWFYDTVRDRQNRLWADSRVKKGVELARNGQHQDAIDVYTQALGMCPDHDDGLVARGAAFATTGRLRQAMQDLSRALSLNPQNDNASSYLQETRREVKLDPSYRRQTPALRPCPVPPPEHRSRRMERQQRADGGTNRTSLEGKIDADRSASISSRGEADNGSKSALATLLQDGAEEDALHKMRVLLEEDERKRKRNRKGEGGDHDKDARGTEESRKKKARKKEKKSKSRRSSSSRHKKDRERRKSNGGHAGGGEGEGGSSASGSDSDDSEARKKRKKHRHKHKKRTRTRSVSPSRAVLDIRNGGSWSGAVGAFSSSGEDSGKEEAHPILQRKKHSLWG